MIKCISSPEDMSALPEKGVEAQKIRSLLLAYGTKYDFCRFFISETAFIAQLNGDYIICDCGEADVFELASFLSFSGFASVFCSDRIGENLSKTLDLKAQKVYLMRFSGNPSAEKPDVLSLSEAYSVIKTGFDFDFEPWYLDMSHRVRHEISRFYGLCGSALAVQYAINGEALISQVASLPEKRGKGFASRLISAVCNELRDFAVYVLCEQELIGFYQKNGFICEKTKYIIKN